MSCVAVPEDLSLEERDELSNIRRRKRELLDDIEVSLANEHYMVSWSSFPAELHWNSLHFPPLTEHSGSSSRYGGFCPALP